MSADNTRLDGESAVGEATEDWTPGYPDRVERVLFVGDTHGEYGWFKRVVATARAERCDVIVQVGDFGYWEHSGSGREFLDRCSRLLVNTELTCIWIDGNHENHTLLRSTYPRRADGFAEVRPNLLYAPRGQRWEWSGVSFVAMGGAYSIDKPRRTEGTSWWPEETITEIEATGAILAGQADVLVCHDAPAGVEGVMGAETVGNKDSYPESAANRDRLRTVFDAVKPKLLVHGHYHHRNSITFEGCRVEGLGRDGDYQSVLAVSLSEVRP